VPKPWDRRTAIGNRPWGPQPRPTSRGAPFTPFNVLSVQPHDDDERTDAQKEWADWAAHGYRRPALVRVL
jgi:hypothetical protein